MTTTTYASRLAATRALLPQWQVDALLITSASNRRWLSGFTGSAGSLLITAESAYLATDFRYWVQAAAQAPAFSLYRQQPPERELAHLLAESGATAIGIEANHLTVGGLTELARKAEGLNWVHLPVTLERLREQKDAAELALIRRAAAITDQVMAQVPDLARPGLSERQLAWELEKRMREAGATALAFEVIVASGPHAALPHHRPGERLLQPGDALVVDMGAEIDGYKSDLTRSFYLGPNPSADYQAIYQLVHQAQSAVLRGIRPGMTSQAIDALARDLIAAAGHREHFGHGLGHSLGLDIHEGPRLAHSLAKSIIPAGVVLTVEPGVYLPEWGGVRIEDLILLAEDGPELLSHCPKTPAIPL